MSVRQAVAELIVAFGAGNDLRATLRTRRCALVWHEVLCRRGDRRGQEQEHDRLGYPAAGYRRSHRVQCRCHRSATQVFASINQIFAFDRSEKLTGIELAFIHDRQEQIYRKGRM